MTANQVLKPIPQAQKQSLWNLLQMYLAELAQYDQADIADEGFF